jgi:hypothetical protein
MQNRSEGEAMNPLAWNAKSSFDLAGTSQRDQALQQASTIEPLRKIKSVPTGET